MCGIAGFLDPKRSSDDNELRALAAGMAGALHHRGPDATGVWVDAEAGVALGHARLSIIDLSAAGAQPMLSASGRFALSYNGEIYNAGELRAELEQKGYTFRGHSDTEVLVEGFAAWGVRATVERLIGMFAFAVFDKATRTLTLGRDRLGIKPLYWGWANGRIVFASELKALATLPDFAPAIDRQALGAYLCTGYVPAPSSIYQDIAKLEPGMLLHIAEDGQTSGESYWSLLDEAERGQAAPFDLDETQARDQLEALLTDAVIRRMVADVPLGVFLSGGIDSATVTALMQANSPTPVRSFTIGFHEKGYNEATQAKAVAAHLGTDHTELYVSPEQALAVVPKLPSIYDEPFADSSQIPTFLVSEMTRQHVTVALSGDGGDELFAGYNRYGQGLRVARALRLLPRPVASCLARLIGAVPPSAWDRLFDVVPEGMRPRQPGDKLQKLAGVLGDDAAGYYRNLIAPWADAWSLVKGATPFDQPAFSEATRARFKDELSWMQYADSVTYLPDDILTKVDRASMAVSLEARVPLLDHRVAAFAWQLPAHLKMRGGQGKWLLRQVLYKYVPKALVERPKMGFGVPIDAWLRGPLKDWAADLLDPAAMTRAGLLDPVPIQEKWAEHLSGKRNWQHFLWNVLMFEAWRREQGVT
ncbi:MAG TPA: asparagine synthase (glutamine-hydrolyzing) [Methyloceanibacter sp.]|nr:asparagine synthase (glutamine-hydrolyzing) [Methyloceanibacter sp.]